MVARGTVRATLVTTAALGEFSMVPAPVVPACCLTLEKGRVIGEA